MSENEETIIPVAKCIYDLVRKLAPRKYVVASWYVKPEDRVWPEDRITVTYRVEGALQ